MLSERDPNANQTTYSYDSFNLYPATSTNALAQSTTYEYDYSAGKPKKVTDPNGAIQETVYDAIDRVKQEKAPDPESGALVIVKSNAYVDTVNAVSVTATTNLSGSLSRDDIQYFDGFGRLIQSRSRS